MANGLYRGSLNELDVIDAATVTLVKGQYITIGEVVVAADERIGLGFSGYDAQDSADGRIYVDLMDNSATPAAIEGKFRIIMMSSQNIPIGEQPVVLDLDITALSQGASDRRAQIAFPFTNVLLSKDKKFVFQVMNTAASAQTVSQANSTILMDCTRQLV